jgi:hypothetical protein
MFPHMQSVNESGKKKGPPWGGPNSSGGAEIGVPAAWLSDQKLYAIPIENAVTVSPAWVGANA